MFFSSWILMTNFVMMKANLILRESKYHKLDLMCFWNSNLVFFFFLQVDWHNRYKWMQRIPRARWEGCTFKSQWFIHLLPLYTSCSKNIILVNYYVEYFFLLCWMGNPQKLPYQTIYYIHRRPWMFQPRLYYLKFAHSPIL